MSAVAEAGNPGNPQGPWKWLPEKQRTLQNPQILGFCGVSFISAVPETGNPGNPQQPWKWLPEKERALQNRQLLGFCGGNPQGPWKWLPERTGLYKVDKFWAFVGFPPFRRSQKLEIQEIHRGVEMASGKGARSPPCSPPCSLPADRQKATFYSAALLAAFSAVLPAACRALGPSGTSNPAGCRV